jgi:hypothetical protein
MARQQKVACSPTHHIVLTALVMSEKHRMKSLFAAAVAMRFHFFGHFDLA